MDSIRSVVERMGIPKIAEMGSFEELAKEAECVDLSVRKGSIAQKNGPNFPIILFYKGVGNFYFIPMPKKMIDSEISSRSVECV